MSIPWYDSACFAVIAGAALAAVCFIYRNEAFLRGGSGGGRCGGSSKYESLLVGAAGVDDSDHDGGGAAQVRGVQMWGSCWRGLHPACLLGLRLLSLLSMSGLLAWDVLSWGTSIFQYYTEWSFALVMLYFAMGSIVSGRGCWEYSKRPMGNPVLTVGRGKVMDDGEEIEGQRAGFLEYLMQILYQTCAGSVILTDVVFWCLVLPFLSNAHLRLNLLMGSMHTANAVFLLVDATLNLLPFPWFRLGYFVLWSCMYVIFQWIVHARGFPWWPYPFLELSTPWAPLWYLCLALAHIPCFGVYKLLIGAKVSLLSTLFPHAFVC